MSDKNLDLQDYLDLREKINNINYQIWIKLDAKIIELRNKIKTATPGIIGDITNAYDHLSEGIIPTVFPLDYERPSDFQNLQEQETELIESIPQEIKNVFSKLFKAFLRNSRNHSPIPGDSLYRTLQKFNKENIDLRYPDPHKNPYLVQGIAENKWRKIAIDELYQFNHGIITMIVNIRNFQAHAEDTGSSVQFELAKRKITDPLSGIGSPTNYVILGNLVIIAVYEFIEILQIWVDTQVRIGKI